MSNCKWCKSTDHTQFYCRRKPRKELRKGAFLKHGKSRKELADAITRSRWIKRNKPDEYGYWDCYLKISRLCLRRVSLETLTIEHVIPKQSKDGSEQRHNLKNLRPSCTFCNAFKGSRRLESLARDFPHLQELL